MMGIDVYGGLGNQMFQYAMAYSLKKIGKTCCLDLSFFDQIRQHNGYELHDVFGIHERSVRCHARGAWEHSLYRYYKRHPVFVEENPFQYNEEIYLMDNVILKGFWQNEKYFMKHKKELLEIFSFPEVKDERNRYLSAKICSTTSVSIHVRRGDYLFIEPWHTFGMEYYLSAMQYMRERIPVPRFYLFTDDADWCRRRFQDHDTIVIGHNSGKESYRDMQMMTLCRHHIIANSSFSWWGAWLGEAEDTITIAPKKWMTIQFGEEDTPAPKRWVKL